MVNTSTEVAGTLVALSNDLAGAVERVGRSVVAVNGRHRLPSSGVVWRTDIVVTADHTVERDEEITVTLHDGRSVPATLVGRDPSTDLAVLRVQGIDATVAEVGDSAALKVGHIGLAIGRPGDTGLSASLGPISAVGGPWRTWRGGQVDRFLRPDLTLYPGFSGGPLVDAGGKVVGINTSGLSRGMGLTIPASTVTAVVEQLLSSGKIARGYLGLGMQPVRLPAELKAKLEVSSDTGLIVVSVEPGGPAEKAGMFIGDILAAVDGTAVGDTDDLQGMLGPDRVGKTVTVRLSRGGAAIDLPVTVGERPQREE